MEFIRTLREKQQTSRQNTIHAEAHDVICLADFDEKIYIAPMNGYLWPFLHVPYYHV